MNVLVTPRLCDKHLNAHIKVGVKVLSLALLAQEKKGPYESDFELPGSRAEVYKTIGDVKLKVYIYEPKGHKAGAKQPAIVFFFGGGWRGGTPKQFQEHCRYLASKGMVAMTADYRVSSRQGTKPVHCVRDGKSAVRWIRQNADRLGIDPDRVAAGGGSAGAAAADIGQYVEFTDVEVEEAPST